MIDSLVIGIGATLIMDLWNLFLKRAFGIASLNYCLLGRWIRLLPNGTFRHANIKTAPQKRYECVTGWCAHYTIGVMLAAAFILLASAEWMARPTLLLALMYGIVTVLLPFAHLTRERSGSTPKCGVGGRCDVNQPMYCRHRRVRLRTVELRALLDLLLRENPDDRCHQ